MTALVLNQVSRRFGGLTALDALTLYLPAGARHAVIGPNGAGKTTLLNLIAGTVRATAGRIVFDGVDITGLPTPARARRGISRTWQHPAVFGRLTVAGNLTLAVTGRDTATHRLRRRQERHAVAELVEQSALTDVADTLAGRLSYGLQRRLELAMAMAGRPRLLLLDEPSAGLDPDEVSQLIGQVRALPADVTVLLIDHNLHVVWSLADTATVLHHGRHLTTGTPDHIRADPQVQSAYLTGSCQPASPPKPRRSTGVTSPILRVRGLHAGYHGAPVVHGVDLDVYPGETVAVLGRNGAGKTTLLASIGGLLPPQPPTRIELMGRPLPARRPHHRARAGLALVPQGRRLFAPLTVNEHLTCAAAARAQSHAIGRRVWTVDEVLTLLPALAARRQHRALQLSGGEQQMLALARALLTNPTLLALDEPSEGLAPAAIDQLAVVLGHLADEGVAVLLAEQNLALTFAVADRICLLHNGGIAVTTTPEAVRGDPAILDDLLAVPAAGIPEATP
jgi:branched-chain amino acid transport system ATP-binding protein